MTHANPSPTVDASTRALHDDSAVVARMSALDRFLPLWILLAMAGGLLIGRPSRA